MSPRGARRIAYGAKTSIHYEFCGITFGPSEAPDRTKVDRHEGYTMVARGEFPDGYHRICKECFGDFEQAFRGEWTRSAPRILPRRIRRSRCMVFLCKPSKGAI